MALYLLHYDKSLGGSGRSGASHYLGWSTLAEFRNRMKEHANGSAYCAITNAFHRIGAKPTVVWVRWEGTRAEEAYLKRQGHIASLCPLCNPTGRVYRKKGEYVARAIYAPMPGVPTTRLPSATGGDLSPINPTGRRGPSRQERRRASTTSSSSRPQDQSGSGGTGSNAVVPQA